ncbi:hypothetical protein [Chryseobacterium sp. R2ACT005]|uniref:hypothetical protein n=1 Tax=Chryseobacterium sp. R2ACT005 TaxID=3416668 RepID=UPI003CF3D207
MNKKLFLILLLIYMSCFSQISYSSWVNSYLQINSYNGNTNPDAYTLTLSGNGNINIPYWRVSVKLKQPITSNNGNYILPANKISFQPVSSSGKAYPNPVPSIPQIGMPLNVILKEGQEVFLIPQSNAALFNQPAQPNGYYSLQIKYSMNLAGGTYLGAYPAWITFTAPLQFTAYDQYNNIIGTMDHNFQFQIGTLSGTPTDIPEMSMKFGAAAMNGTLEFKNIQDYVNGANVTYSNALIVKSNTKYQIKLKSLQTQFSSSAGNFLPLDAVQLNLIPISGNMGTVYTVLLSTAPQIIAAGSSTQNTDVYYDMKYSTKPNDQRFINAKAEDYTTTLQFEITPQ